MIRAQRLLKALQRLASRETFTIPISPRHPSQLIWDELTARIVYAHDAVEADDVIPEAEPEKDALIRRQHQEIQVLKNARDDRTEALFRERMAEAKVAQTNVQFIAMKTLLKQYLSECESPVPDLMHRSNLRKRLATLLTQCEAEA